MSSKHPLWNKENSSKNYDFSLWSRYLPTNLVPTTSIFTYNWLSDISLLLAVNDCENDRSRQTDRLPNCSNFISVSFTIIYKMSTSISIPPASHINSRYTAIIVATRVVTHKHSKDNFLRDLWRHGHKYPTEILATFPLKMTNRRSSPFWNAFIRYFRNIFFLLLSFSLWCLFFFRVSQKSSSPRLVMDDGNLLNFIYNAS